MKKIILLIAVLVIVLSQLSATAQKQGKELIDSLYATLKKTNSDTVKVNTLNNIALYKSDNNVDTAIFYTTLALQLSERANLNNENIGWKKGVAYSYIQLGLYQGWNGNYKASIENYNKAVTYLDELINSEEISLRLWAKNNKARTLRNIGEVLEEQNNYSKALEYHFNSLTIYQEIANKKGIAKQFNNIGNVYYYQGNYAKAQEFYFKALKTNEEIGNKESIANNLFLIGNVQLYLQNYVKALEYYFKSLNIYQELKNTEWIGNLQGNIGFAYFNKGDYSQSLDYNFKALKIKQEIGKKEEIANTLGNIGNVYLKQADLYTDIKLILQNKAIEFYSKALLLAEDIKDKNVMSMNLGNLGLVYSIQKKYNESEKYFVKALALADTVGNLEYQKNFHKSLSTMYSDTKQFEKSLFHYKKFTLIKDSLVNADNMKKIAATEETYRIEKKEAEEKAEIGRIAATTKRKVMLQYFGIFSVIIIVLSFVFLGTHIKLSVKTIDYLGFVGILLFFEFLEVLLEPTVSHYTHGLPALYMLVNIVIAATIKPAHHFIEKHMVRVTASIKEKRHHKIKHKEKS